MPRPKPDLYDVKPKTDGIYWIFDHKRGTMYPLIYRNGRWHDGSHVESMQHKEIIEGPLPHPTQEQIAGQAGYFESVRQKIWAETGYDPAWPMVPLEFAHPKPKPGSTPYGMIDGYYWVRLAGATAHDPPMFVFAHEGYWAGIDLDSGFCDHNQVETPLVILFGPVPKPARDRVKHLRPGGLTN